MDALYLDTEYSKGALLTDLASTFDNISTSPDIAIVCSTPDLSQPSKDDPLSQPSPLPVLERKDLEKQHPNLIWAHSLILRNQSKYFAKACTGHWERNKVGRIDLSALLPEVREMIRYCYTFDYEYPSSSKSYPMPFHVGMFILAEKYKVRGLAKLACEKLEAAAWKTLRGTEWDELIEAIEIAYQDSTPDPDDFLRSTIIRIVVDEHLKLFQGEDDPFRKLVRKYEDFAVDLVSAMGRDLAKHERSNWVGGTGSGPGPSKVERGAVPVPSNFDLGPGGWVTVKPDEFRGKVFRCPECRTEFVASMRDDASRK